ncbi:MAG TPA: hypothetical protein VMU93_16505 [Caulobacteraceae bacterium]|nr:hypothetical protein [Caulobacteraceae bacterium]
MAKQPASLDRTGAPPGAEPDPPALDEAAEAGAEGLSPTDDGPPIGALHGENHTRRPVKTEADRGQGPKTRAANKERVKGSRLFNPR